MVSVVQVRHGREHESIKASYLAKLMTEIILVGESTEQTTVDLPHPDLVVNFIRSTEGRPRPSMSSSTPCNITRSPRKSTFLTP